MTDTMVVRSPASAASEWLPIETAPKDGTHVLLLFEASGRRFAHIGHYISEKTIRFDNIVSEYMGWRTGDILVAMSDLKPTHWAPLPPFEVPVRSSALCADEPPTENGR